MANKYLALQKDVFDISKVTVVGSPTITSDGVASGFNGTSDCAYSEVDASILDGTKDILVEGEFTTSDAIGGLQGIFYLGSLSNTAGVYFRLNNAKFELVVFTTAGDYSSELSTSYVVANTTYHYKIYFDKNTKRFTLKISLDGKNYNDECSLTINQIYLPNNAIILWGCRHLTNFAQQFKGSINLPATKVYSNNQLIYTPTKPTYLLERRKPKVWNKGQFTVVGNPNISESGVASGFSTSNYINLPIFNLSGGDFEIDTLIDYTPTGVGQCFFRCATDTYLGAFGFVVGTYASNKLYIEGTTAAVTYDTALTAGKYLLKLVVKDGTANVYLNGNLVITGEYTKSISAAYITMGQGKNAVPFTGSMDLKAQSVKIKGKEVFNGVKEQFYMLRR